MKKQTVYMCSKGHLFYGDEPPDKCKHCGDTQFGLITADYMEDFDELSEEPSDGSN